MSATIDMAGARDVGGVAAILCCDLGDSAHESSIGGLGENMEEWAVAMGWAVGAENDYGR